MRKILATLVVTLGCAGPAGTAAAQDPTQLPDLKGRWVGTNEAIMLGTPLHHGSDANQPRLNTLEFIITIEGQAVLGHRRVPAGSRADPRDDWV